MTTPQELIAAAQPLITLLSQRIQTPQLLVGVLLTLFRRAADSEPSLPLPLARAYHLIEPFNLRLPWSLTILLVATQKVLDELPASDRSVIYGSLLGSAINHMPNPPAILAESGRVLEAAYPLGNIWRDLRW